MNPSLSQLYKRLVVPGGISKNEFWAQHSLLDLNSILFSQYRDSLYALKNTRGSEHLTRFRLSKRIKEHYFVFICKNILTDMSNQMRRNRRNGLKRKFAQANRAVNHSNTNDDEMSGQPPTKRARILEEESTE